MPVVLQLPKILILIPARYASSRFPGKPLAQIAGKSMIQRVYESVAPANNDLFTSQAHVVTDDSRIEEHVHKFGGNCIRVDDELSTGSERVYLAYKRFFSDQSFDLILNLQGDEPLMDAELLKEIIKFQLKSSFDIGTIVKKENDMIGFLDRNRVKAVFCPESGRCLYFSRAPVPYNESSVCDWYLHIGIYAYRPQALIKFFSLGPSLLEKREQLEQLRALEAGLEIGAIVTKKKLMGVDTPKDLQEIEGVFCGKSE